MSHRIVNVIWAYGAELKWSKKWLALKPHPAAGHPFGYLSILHNYAQIVNVLAIDLLV